jgi:DNA-binding response OmpR family regulator
MMPEVVAIRWPEERQDAARFVTAGVAVLYLVRAEDEPPVPTGCLEDWVRIPGDDRDLHARIAALELRATLHHAPPFVDGDNRLHHRGRVVALDAKEAQLAAALLARFGAVVSDQELLDAVSAGTATSTTSLRGEVARLRSHLRDLDLAIRRARRGYVLLASQ